MINDPPCPPNFCEGHPWCQTDELCLTRRCTHLPASHTWRDRPWSSWRIGSKPKRTDLTWIKSIGVPQQLDSAGQNETLWWGSADDLEDVHANHHVRKRDPVSYYKWPDPPKTPTLKTTRPRMILHDSFWCFSGAALVIHVQCPLFSWKLVSRISRSFLRTSAPKSNIWPRVFIAEWRFRELRILRVHLQQGIWAAGDEMRVSRTVAQ